MNLLYRLLYPIALLLFKLFNGLKPKLKIGHILRKPKDGVKPWLAFPKNTQPIWIHCASGEFEYALPLIRKIKSQNFSQKILITFFTPSYIGRIEQERMVDMYCPSPWDLPATMAEFIAHHNPKMLLFARTDIWHEMTRQAHLAKVPVGVFSMTFNKTPGFFRKLFLKWQFKYVDHFFVASSDDRNKLSVLVPESKISISGDSRYQQCLFRLGVTKHVKIPAGMTTKKVFVAASTWPEDEAVLFPIIAKHPNTYHWVLVPHEVDKEHIEALKNKCQEAGLNPVLFSEIHTWNMEGALIVDTVGVLAHLYKIADFSFVGGSYKKQVHSVMESLVCGCLTFVGPYFKNNREAVEFSSEGFLKTYPDFPFTPVQVCEADQLENKISETAATWLPRHRDRLKQITAEKAKLADSLYEQIKQELT